MRMDLDTGFPGFSGNADRDLRDILNYLFMLREQLEYLTCHLDQENFTEEGLKELGLTITKPITLKVENGDHSSVLQLMAEEVLLASATIELKGLVSFADLKESGKTIINGENITTGTLKAIDLYALAAEGATSEGSMRLCYQDYDKVVGGIQLDAGGAGTDDENQYRMFIYTDKVDGKAFAMKLRSADAMSLSAVEGVYISGGKGVQISAPSDSMSVDGQRVAIVLAGDVRINGRLYLNGNQI